MEEKVLEQKATVAGQAIGYFIGMGFIIALALIFDINPTKEYGWFAGCLHGAWIPANWIISFFKEGTLLKAPLHTNAYNTWWWIGAVCGVWTWVKFALGLIGSFRNIANE